MEISPAVPAPKPGDPITAKWASDLSAAVNSAANPADSVGAVSSPFGKASPAPGMPMLGNYAAPMLFDCRLGDVSGTDHVYCFIPHIDQYAYANLFGDWIRPASDQARGTSTNPWVDLGAVTGDSWIVLYFTAPTETPYPTSETNTYRWRVALVAKSSPPAVSNLPSDAWEETPLVLLARYEFDQYVYAKVPVLFQLRHGFIECGTPCWVQYGTATRNRATSIGGGDGFAGLSFHASGEVHAEGDFYVNVNNAKFYYGAVEFAPATIKDGDGNNVSVLKAVTP